MPAITGSAPSTTGADVLAIRGGAPTVTLDQTAANRWPMITSEDEEAVLRVLRTGELSSGHLPNGYPIPHSEVVALEKEFSAWLGVPHVLAHNNGTAAIFGGLFAMGIGTGDEVIVPSTTWWSSVLPILHLGGVPVFAETDMQTLALDPADIEARITKRTKAIVVTHLFGIPAKMDEIMTIARRHGVKVMEDASHAHGASYRGRKIGTIGDCAVFSLQVNKLVPSAEGGLLVSADPAITHEAAKLGHYERLVVMQGHPDQRFAATGLGYKFRMSPLSAAVARVQLRHVNERNAVRNGNCVHLSKRLAALGMQTFMSGDPGLEKTERVYFEFLVRYDEARFGAPIGAVAKALLAEGAQVGAPRYPLLHQQPVFSEGLWAKLARLENVPGLTLPKYDVRALPRTTSGNGTLIKLPSFPNASRELLDQYARAFEKVLGAAGSLPGE